MQVQIGVVIQSMPYIQSCYVGIFENGVVANEYVLPYLSPFVSNPLDVWFGGIGISGRPKAVDPQTASYRTGGGTGATQVVDSITREYYEKKGGGKAHLRVDGFEFAPDPGSIALVLYQESTASTSSTPSEPICILGFLSPGAVATMEGFLRAINPETKEELSKRLATAKTDIPNFEAYLFKEQSERYKQDRAMLEPPYTRKNRAEEGVMPAFAEHIYWKIGKCARLLEKLPLSFIKREARRISHIYRIGNVGSYVGGAHYYSLNEWLTDFEKRAEYTERSLASETYIASDKEGRIKIVSDVKNSTADLYSDGIDGDSSINDMGTYITLHKDFSEISCNSPDGVGFLGLKNKVFVQQSEEVYRIEVGVQWDPITKRRKVQSYGHNTNNNVYSVDTGPKAAPGTYSLEADLLGAKVRKGYMKGEERLSFEVGGSGSTGVYIRGVGTPKVTISAGPDFGMVAGDPDRLQESIEDALQRVQESPVGEVVISADTIRLNYNHLFHGDIPDSALSLVRRSGPVPLVASLLPVFSGASKVLGELVNSLLFLVGIRKPGSK